MEYIKQVSFDIIIIIIIIIIIMHYYFAGTTLRPITEHIYIYIYMENTQVRKMKGNSEERSNKKLSVNQRSLYYNCHESSC